MGARCWASYSPTPNPQPPLGMAAQPASHQRHANADLVVGLKQQIWPLLERPGDRVRAGIGILTCEPLAHSRAIGEPLALASQHCDRSQYPGCTGRAVGNYMVERVFVSQDCL